MFGYWLTVIRLEFDNLIVRCGYCGEEFDLNYDPRGTLVWSSKMGCMISQCPNCHGTEENPRKI